MTMPRVSLSLTRVKRVQNEDVTKLLEIRSLGEKARERGLRWYGQERRREEAYVGKRILETVSPGKRRRIDQEEGV